MPRGISPAAGGSRNTPRVALGSLGRPRGTFTTEQRAVAGVMEDAIIPDAGTSKELLVFRTGLEPAAKADSQEFPDCVWTLT